MRKHLTLFFLKQVFFIKYLVHKYGLFHHRLSDNLMCNKLPLQTYGQATFYFICLKGHSIGEVINSQLVQIIRMADPEWQFFFFLLDDCIHLNI